MDEELKITISAEISDLKNNVSDAQQTVEGFADETENAKNKSDKSFNDISVSAAAKFAIVSEAVSDAISKIKEIISSSVSYGDTVDKQSQKMQLSTTAYQEWSHVLQHNGTDIQSLKIGINKITKDLGDMADKVEVDTSAYDALGISLKNSGGSFKSTEDILNETILSLSDMTDVTERNAIAQDLFGRGYAELLPTLNSGSDAIQDLIDSADKYAVISEEDVKASAAFSDAQFDLQQQLQKIRSELAGDLLPVITEVFEFVTDVFSSLEGNSALQTIVNELKDFLLPILSNVLDFLGDFFSFLEEHNIVGKIKDKLLPILRDAFDFLGEVFSFLEETVMQALEKIESELGDKILSAITGVFDFITNVFNFLTEHQGLLDAIAITIGVITTAMVLQNTVQGIKAAMNAAEATSLGALVAVKIADAAATIAALAPYLLIVAAIAAVIAIIVVCIKHWDDIKAAIANAWNFIKEKTVAAVDAVKQKFADMKQNISDKVQAIKDSIKEKFEAAKQAITEPIEKAKAKVKELIDKIKGFFKFEWKLPKLKMPHITITGEFSLAPPSIPKFSIDWYAQGGVFDKPSLFGYQGRLGGLGEDGAEAIVPLEKNTKWLEIIADKIAARQGSTPIVLQVDGKTFAQTSITSINQLTKQTGNLGLILG